MIPYPTIPPTKEKAMPDTKGQHTNEKETRSTEEKKDEGQEPKAHAGASGEGTDNTSAGSGDRGGHRKREGGTPEGK
jgi:hypothetical protein